MKKDHGSSENLISYLKSRRDDIDALWIVFDNAVTTQSPDGAMVIHKDVAGIIQYCDGSTSMIHSVDAELVLNDEGFRKLQIPFRLLLPGRSLPPLRSRDD